MNTEQNVEGLNVSPAIAKPMLPAVFSSTDMVSFGYFIRDNYYGVGSPKLMSYKPEKYPHGSMPEIFHYWCLENGR